MKIGLIIDGVILLIIAICTFIGYKRGLVKVAVGILAFTISLVVTLIFYRPLANFVINNTKIDDNISSVIYEKIKDEDLDNSDNEILQFAEKYIIDDVKNSTTSFIATRIGESIVEVGTFIALIISLRLILFVISVVLSLIAELPIIKQFDKVRWNHIRNTSRSDYKLNCFCTYYSYTSTY